MTPNQAGERAALGSLGKLATAGIVHHAPKSDLVLLLGIGGGQQRQGGSHHILHLGKAEGARRDSYFSGRPSYDGADHIVGGEGQQEFLLHPVDRLGSDVLQANRGFQRTRVGLNIPTAALECQDLLGGKSQCGEQV